MPGEHGWGAEQLCCHSQHQPRAAGRMVGRSSRQPMLHVPGRGEQCSLCRHLMPPLLLQLHPAVGHHKRSVLHTVTKSTWSAHLPVGRGPQPGSRCARDPYSDATICARVPPTLAEGGTWGGTKWYRAMQLLQHHHLTYCWGKHLATSLVHEKGMVVLWPPHVKHSEMKLQ